MTNIENRIVEIPRDLLAKGEEPVYREVSPQELVQQNEWRGLRQSLIELFPEIERTAVPELITEVLDTISPLCQTIDHKGQFLLRGSSVKRLVLGTPIDYFSVKKLFTELEWPHWQKHIGDRSTLVNSVIERIMAGPDVDVMYRKKDRVTDSDIITLLKNFTEAKNQELRSSGYEIMFNDALLSQWNGATDKRVYSQLTFYKISKYGEKKALLRFDLGEIPQNNLLVLDARLAGDVMSRDAVSTALLQKRNNDHWYIFLERDIKEILKYQPDVLIYSHAQPNKKFLNVGRLILHRSFWLYQQIIRSGKSIFIKNERLIEFIQRQANQYGLPKNYWERPAVNLNYWEDINISSLSLLEPREADIITTFVLSAAFAGWEWPILAEAIGLLKLTRLGQILTPDVLTKFMRWGIEDNVSVNSFKPFSIDLTKYDLARAAERVNTEYRFSLWKLRPSELWPLVLVRWLKEHGYISEPATLATFIDLINPVKPLREKRDQIERAYGRYSE